MCDQTGPDGPDWTPITRADVPDDYRSIAGGLRLDQGIVRNAAGCWRGRYRNKSWRRYGTARWLWIDQIDHRAPARYRSRVYLSVTGERLPPMHRLETTCGDPHCLNPHHLDLVEIEHREVLPRTGGRYGWAGEGEDEVYCWIADPVPADTPAPAPPPRLKASPPPVPKRAPKPKAEPKPPRPKVERPKAPPRIPKPKPDPKPPRVKVDRPKPTPRVPKPKPPRKGRARGERSLQSALTEADVRAIREAARETSQVALAARYGLSRMAVYKILTRKSWAHVV